MDEMSFRGDAQHRTRNLEIPGLVHPSRLLPTWTMILANSGKPRVSPSSVGPSRNDNTYSANVPSDLLEAAMTETDVVIIGAGHNGLTCAAYLAMGDLRVKVVERRKVVGGAAVTEEFHPGFRNSVAAYTVSLLNPQISSDLKLSDDGLRIVERRAQNFLPSPDGSYLLTGEGRTRQSVAKFSERDAATIDTFSRELEAIADVLRQFVLRAPPNIVEGFGPGAIREAL